MATGDLLRSAERYNPGVTIAAKAARGADVIVRNFDDYHTRFRAITRRSKQRFERRDWDGIHRDTVKRLDLHPHAVSETLEALRDQLGEALQTKELWSSIKETFSHAILGLDDFELAQTFFNSLRRSVFPDDSVDPRIDYVAGDFPLPYKGWEMASARMYAVRRVDSSVLEKILEDADFRVQFRDLAGDCELATRQLNRRMTEAFDGGWIEAIDVVRPVFVRGKGAYIVGRIRRGEELMPMVLALVNSRRGLEVDAVLDTEDQASILFSFARWYFQAEVESPREVIGFLHSILPRKRISELYISLGFNKHGKTELYADLETFIRGTDEQFVVAPGKRGLVMSVFTLPSFPFVFKVIKDYFPANKKTTRGDVMTKYRDVLRHDRVGRLVDFQEFEHLRFPRSRFAPEMLDELLEQASLTVSLEGDDVLIRHLYAGRRVRPLDLFVNERPEEEAKAAIVDWGRALKDLAAADIFAGDMLLKNFGVTRHGRVVFYDYDELCPLSECNFRLFPTAHAPYQELEAEPWFTVGTHDVFPEELRTFLKLPADLMEAFEEHHSDLFELDFWRTVQEHHSREEMIEASPYSESQRLRPAGPVST